MIEPFDKEKNKSVENGTVSSFFHIFKEWLSAVDGKHLLRTLTWGVTTLLVFPWVQYLASSSTSELRYDQFFTIHVTFIFEFTIPYCLIYVCQS